MSGWKLHTSETVLKAIHNEIQRQQTSLEDGDSIIPLRFGRFLEAVLFNKDCQRNEFAEKLGVNIEFVDALIEGMLPAETISDAMVAQIAQIIDYDLNLLRILLNRPFVPNTGEQPTERYYLPIERPPERELVYQQAQPRGGIYTCGQRGCPGHASFSQVCSPYQQVEVQDITEDTTQGFMLLDDQVDTQVHQPVAPPPEDLAHFLQQQIHLNQVLGKLRDELEKLQQDKASILRLIHDVTAPAPVIDKYDQLEKRIDDVTRSIELTGNLIGLLENAYNL
jgi:plasmid maintenance system antidote protein VapI